MNPMIKRIVLLGVIVVAGLALFFSVGGLDQGLPAANPAAVAPVPTTAAAASARPTTEAERKPSRADELQQRLSANPKDTAALAEFADYLYQSKRYTQAADILHQALEVEPKNTKFRVGFAQALFYAGMPSMAQEQLKLAVTNDPNSAEAHFNYALVMSHGASGDLDIARASWQAVVRIDGDGELGRKAKEFLAQTGPNPDGTNKN